MANELTIPQNLRDAIIYYADNQRCVEIMVAMRWPDGVVCPHCQGVKCNYINTEKTQAFKCYTCRKKFTVKTGTVLEDSPISLTKWLPALWLLTGAKNGISSCELARTLGVTQKTAWFMLHRIRYVLASGTFERLEGTVEADETFIGGLEKNKHESQKLKQGRGSVGKAVVMGILERGDNKNRTSRVKTNVLPDTSSASLHPEIKATVVEGAELFTDAHAGYNGLADDYLRGVVDHAVKYVEGRVHTNGLENFWSLTKRTLKGTYVSVEPEHLTSYLDEQAFRFNERKLDDAGRFVLALSKVAGKRLTYKELIGDTVESDSLRGVSRVE